MRVILEKNMEFFLAARQRIVNDKNAPLDVLFSDFQE